MIRKGFWYIRMARTGDWACKPSKPNLISNWSFETDPIGYSYLICDGVFGSREAVVKTVNRRRLAAIVDGDWPLTPVQDYLERTEKTL